MNWDWQNLTVLVLVVSASGYLARVLWQTMGSRRAAACGSCGSCPASGKQEPEVFALGSDASGTPAGRQS